IEEIAAQHLDAVAQWCIRGTAAAKMRRGCLDNEKQFPAAVPESFAPVDVLGVKEKLLIQSADLIYRRAAGEPETAIKHFHLCATVIFPIAHLKTGKKPPATQHAVQPQQPARRVPDRG